MKFIDLSHRITDGMVTFPGIPGVVIDSYMTREENAVAYGEKAASLLDRITMVNISGTYLDAPLHRNENGVCIADIPLEKCVDLEYEVVKLPEGKSYFDKDDLKEVGKKHGAVLLCSGHSEKFGTHEYGINPPYLTVDGAKDLIEKGVVFIGIDSPLIDNMEELLVTGCPVHDVILNAGAVICEDMTNLEASIPHTKNGRLFAAPVKVEMASFTTRVYVKTSSY